MSTAIRAAGEIRRMREQRSMHTYEALIYPVFLMIALAGRIVPARGPRSRSVFTEAADLTQSVVPWFFVLR